MNKNAKLLSGNVPFKVETRDDHYLKFVSLEIYEKAPLKGTSFFFYMNGIFRDIPEVSSYETELYTRYSWVFCPIRNIYATALEKPFTNNISKIYKKNEPFLFQAAEINLQYDPVSTPPYADKFIVAYDHVITGKIHLVGEKTIPKSRQLFWIRYFVYV